MDVQDAISILWALVFIPFLWWMFKSSRRSDRTLFNEERQREQDALHRRSIEAAERQADALVTIADRMSDADFRDITR